jgi:hypothetical protein
MLARVYLFLCEQPGHGRHRKTGDEQDHTPSFAALGVAVGVSARAGAAASAADMNSMTADEWGAASGQAATMEVEEEVEEEEEEEEEERVHGGGLMATASGLDEGRGGLGSGGGGVEVVEAGEHEARCLGLGDLVRLPLRPFWRPF